jgi:hypothetical protein
VSDPQSQPSAPSRPTVGLDVARCLTVVMLLAACLLAPAVVSVAVNPWAGMLVSLGGLWAWARFGPRPMPGFLPGLVCLWGFAAIVGAFIACGVIAVRG